jgi:hypothetical protein
MIHPSNITFKAVHIACGSITYLLFHQDSFVFPKDVSQGLNEFFLLLFRKRLTTGVKMCQKENCSDITYSGDCKSNCTKYTSMALSI